MIASSSLPWLACERNAGGPDYALHKDYFDALARWHAKLTPLQQETVLVVIDTFTHGHKVAAEGFAAMLPPAPKCPL